MLEKFHRKYIGDRNFYKRYIALALPMIIQNAVTNLVSFLDNIMVGQLGTEQMSGVAIVNQLIFVYNLAVFGAVSAASIFGAQYFGKGNHKGHMYSFRFKLYAALTVTALTILLFVTKGAGLCEAEAGRSRSSPACRPPLAVQSESVLPDRQFPWHPVCTHPELLPGQWSGKESSVESVPVPCLPAAVPYSSVPEY